MVGKIFPRSDRSPRIVPHATAALYKGISRSDSLSEWGLGRNARVSSGFYISHAQELKRG